MRTFLITVLIAAIVGSVSAFSPVAVPQQTCRADTALGMKCVSSIGSMKKRSNTCQVVRRRGRIYVIDKKNPRLKVRQGGAKMKKRQKK
eukprot:CAMPEP_0197173036 /NCGR_PEP_ID=MMETSP1423-20130617/97_1 /TAXON_ID=476441 /ORGANISM="Pseudo-nitzschia heimii, Strain UNC1101" /LENGTH=88 /DNA_ID=CAMNT_0042621781 /DNA_START=84 /DNA_END=350 /DNA_ORIENTATION=+